MRRCSRRTLVAVIACAALATVIAIGGCVTSGTLPRESPASQPRGAQNTGIVEEWTIGPAPIAVGRYGGSIRIEGPEPPTTFNPAMFAGLDVDAQVHAMLFAPLVDVHPQMGITAGNLAKDWTVSPDQRSVEITLRPGLRWSDGAPLTVDDVVYSYTELYLNPATGGIGAEIAEQARGISVEQTGNRTVRIASTLPTHDLLAVLSYPPLPRHVIEPWLQEHSAVDFLDFWASYSDLSGLVGSGPFVLASFEEAVPLEGREGQYTCTVLEFERNRRYHRRDASGRRLPYLDTVTFLYRDEMYGPSTLYCDELTDAAYLPLLAPDGTWLGRWPYSTRAIAREAADAVPGSSHVVTDTAKYIGEFVTFNMQRVPGPDGGGLAEPMATWFNDLRFRRAISHLLPRDRIVADLLDGDGAPAYGRLVPGSAYSYPPADAVVPRYDPAAADILLSEMGLVDRDGDGVREDEGGTPVAFTMITNQENQYRQELLAILVETFAAAGLEVTPESVPMNEVVQSIYGASYEMLLLGLTGADSVGEGWDVWASGGGLHLWDIGEPDAQRSWEQDLDELYRQWRMTIDADRLRELADQVQLILAEQLPLISIVAGYDYLLMRESYRNLRLTGQYRDQWPLEYVFLDE